MDPRQSWIMIHFIRCSTNRRKVFCLKRAHDIKQSIQHMVSLWPTWIIHLWEKLWVGISLALPASSLPHNVPGTFSPQLAMFALPETTWVVQLLCKHTVNLALQTWHLLHRSPDHRECHTTENHRTHTGSATRVRTQICNQKPLSLSSPVSKSKSYG